MKPFFPIAALLIVSISIGCQHDTPPPCTSETVNYAKQIQPILTSNCAYSGCHDGTTRAEGVQLTDYSHVKQYVTGGENELYEVITATGKKQMPPTGALPQAQISLIKKWLDQGGLSLDCN